MLICQSKPLGKIDLNCREVQFKVKVFDWRRKVSFVFTYDSYQKDQETIKGSNLHKLSNLISKNHNLANGISNVLDNTVNQSFVDWSQHCTCRFITWLYSRAVY